MLIDTGGGRHAVGVNLVGHLVEITDARKVLHLLVRIILVHSELHLVRELIREHRDFAPFISKCLSRHLEEHVEQEVMHQVIIIFPVTKH